MSKGEEDFFIKGEIKGKHKDKKNALYMLYLYHQNYKNEDWETKREIREYYETQLRYKGAFYKDKRIFEIRGNPLEWEENKITRFKPKEEEHRYFVGMNDFSNFVYPSTNLIEVSISKEVNISLIDNQQVEMLNIYYDEIVRKEVKRLIGIMNRIDNSKGVYLIKSLYDNTSEYRNTEEKQIVFKIQIDDIIRYQSTKYVPENHLVEVSINVLESYLSRLTGIETKRMPSFVNGTIDYEEFDEGFDLQHCSIIRIYLNKTTVMYNSSLGERYYSGVDTEINTLTSLEIMAKNG